jgi:hypothetical protein
MLAIPSATNFSARPSATSDCGAGRAAGAGRRRSGGKGGGLWRLGRTAGRGRAGRSKDPRALCARRPVAGPLPPLWSLHRAAKACRALCRPAPNAGAWIARVAAAAAAASVAAAHLGPRPGGVDDDSAHAELPGALVDEAAPWRCGDGEQVGSGSVGCR